MIAKVIILVMTITEVNTEQILANHGIQFSDPKPIHFVNNHWTHTFEFEIPDYNFDTELVNDFSMCRNVSHSHYEKRCPTSIRFNGPKNHTESDLKILLNDFPF
ncbi:hypothetical protein DPMN_164230 [Dreissena polymorpha]|uniref:Uncharacterized protein n=1 Tax=Dreissena polymorpha TaxID=45954 RepID=A0A9D4EUR9_DREPO|nr:hypothetical protein DPMN_164230 [Dreissena polymorpha]